MKSKKEEKREQITENRERMCVCVCERERERGREKVFRLRSKEGVLLQWLLRERQREHVHSTQRTAHNTQHTAEVHIHSTQHKVESKVEIKSSTAHITVARGTQCTVPPPACARTRRAHITQYTVHSTQHTAHSTKHTAQNSQLTADRTKYRTQ